MHPIAEDGADAPGSPPPPRDGAADEDSAEAAPAAVSLAPPPSITAEEEAAAQRLSAWAAAALTDEHGATPDQVAAFLDRLATSCEVRVCGWLCAPRSARLLRGKAPACDAAARNQPYSAALRRDAARARGCAAVAAREAQFSLAQHARSAMSPMRAR